MGMGGDVSKTRQGRVRTDMKSAGTGSDGCNSVPVQASSARRPHSMSAA